MCGITDQQKLSTLRDKQGISLADALADIGLDFHQVNRAKRAAGEFKCFFELHIEQGAKISGYSILFLALSPLPKQSQGFALRSWWRIGI